MALLSKQQIIEAKDLEMEKVFVPEWADGDPEAYVQVKALTGREKGKFDESLITPESRAPGRKPQLDMTDYGPKLAVVSMCDDDGNRLFTLDDLDVLAGKSAIALQRVVEVAMRINGMKADIEDEVKN